jgi:hypothetical protein
MGEKADVPHLTAHMPGRAATTLAFAADRAAHDRQTYFRVVDMNAPYGWWLIDGAY